MLYFVEGRDYARTVNPHTIGFIYQTEFNSEPVKCFKPFTLYTFCVNGSLTEHLGKRSEVRIGKQRHMSEHIVEKIRGGGIIAFLLSSYIIGRGENPTAQKLKEVLFIY